MPDYVLLKKDNSTKGKRREKNYTSSRRMKCDGKSKNSKSLNGGICTLEKTSKPVYKAVSRH